MLRFNPTSVVDEYVGFHSDNRAMARNSRLGYIRCVETKIILGFDMIWEDKDYEWHPYFAWLPVEVKVNNGANPKYVWWETIERQMRRGTFRSDYWVYRLPEKQQ